MRVTNREFHRFAGHEAYAFHVPPDFPGMNTPERPLEPLGEPRPQPMPSLAGPMRPANRVRTDLGYHFPDVPRDGAGYRVSDEDIEHWDRMVGGGPTEPPADGTAPVRPNGTDGPRIPPVFASGQFGEESVADVGERIGVTAARAARALL